MAAFYKKYKHGLIIFSYAIFYMIAFRFLENRPIHSFHIIHTIFDDLIPFCEFFIVPYFLWFPYMVFTVLYFIVKKEERHEYYQLIFNLMMGMTVFLIVSYVYPNALQLRPTTFARDNIFVDAVKFLYATDTPTNVLPSIHVFNSLAIHMAVTSSKSLRRHPVIQYGSLALTLCIILSTMFLKQHSFVDVSMGATLALAGYLFFYRDQKVPYKALQKQNKKRRSIHF